MHRLRLHLRVVTVVVADLKADAVQGILDHPDLDHVLGRNRGRLAHGIDVLQFRHAHDLNLIGGNFSALWALRHHGSEGEDGGDGEQPLPVLHGGNLYERPHGSLRHSIRYL